MPEADKERDPEIEQIIEEKVQDLRQELKEEKKERKKLQQKVENLKPNSNQSEFKENPSSGSEGISRRSFLKKAGLGTLGLGALMSPVSALDVRSSDFSVFTDNSSNPYFSVGHNGPVNIQNTHIDLNSNSIQNIGGLELPYTGPSSDLESGENRFWVDQSNQSLKVKIGGKIYTSEIQRLIPDTLVERGVVNEFYSFKTKSPGDYTVNTNSVLLEGPDTGSGTDENWAQIVTPSDTDNSNLNQVDVDFSLTQFGDSDANVGDFKFRIFEGDATNVIDNFGNNSVDGDLDRAIRTIDLSGITGTNSIGFRAYRTNSGNYETFGGSVTIYNIQFS